MNAPGAHKRDHAAEWHDVSRCTTLVRPRAQIEKQASGAGLWYYGLARRQTGAPPYGRVREFGAGRVRALNELLWQGSDLRLARVGVGGSRPFLSLRTISVEPSKSVRARMRREYAMAPVLDQGWALKPTALIEDVAGWELRFEDFDGIPVRGPFGRPDRLEPFLRLSLGAAQALSQAHRKDLIHKDLRRESILANEDFDVRIAGFGAAAASGATGPTRPPSRARASSSPIGPRRRSAVSGGSRTCGPICMPLASCSTKP